MGRTLAVRHRENTEQQLRKVASSDGPAATSPELLRVDVAADAAAA